MSKYLISKTEVYRADTENEAGSLIESAKQSSDYTLPKYTRNVKREKGFIACDSSEYALAGV